MIHSSVPHMQPSTKQQDMLELVVLRNRVKFIERSIKNRSWGVDWHSCQDLDMTNERIKELEYAIEQR